MDHFQPQTAISSAFEKPTFFSHEELQLIRRVVFHTDTVGKNKLSFFFENASHLSGGIYWYALRLAYEMSAVRNSHLRGLAKVLKGQYTCFAMMEKKEVATFCALPEVITVYKVLTAKQWESCSHDYSWYLDEKGLFVPVLQEGFRKPKQIAGFTGSLFQNNT